MDISQLSDEEIKELIVDSDKITEIYTSIGDNEEKKFELIQKIDSVVIKFIDECKQKDFDEIKDEDKLFYEKYLDEFLDENIKAYGTNPEVLNLIDVVRSKSIKFKDSKTKEYFKKLSTEKNIFKKLIEKVKESTNLLNDENFEDVDKILKYFIKSALMQSQTFKEVFSQYVDKLKNIDLDKNSESLAINYFLVNFAKLPSNNAEKCSENLQENIKELVEIVLDKNPNLFIKSNTFSRLNQIRENEVFPEDLRNSIESAFSKKYENHELMGIGKYQSKWPKMTDKIKNFETMETEEFDDFILGIIEEKILTGKIPEEYCDYIINQKLTIKSPLNDKINDYFCVLKRAFEDKTIHILEKEGIKNYFAKVVSPKEENGLIVSTDLGVHNSQKKQICYSSEYLKNLSLYNPKMLGTLFHEVQHAKQKIEIESQNISSPIFYEMQKEKIIRNNISKYYKDNYRFMQIEIDARIAGNVEKVKYLQRLGFPDKLIAKIIDKSAEEEKEVENISKAKTKVVNGKREYVDVTFQKILKNNPKYIANMPLLAIEFENDGTRKGNLQILKEYDEKLKSSNDSEQQYLDLVKYIVKNNSEISDLKMISDLQLLCQYTPSKQLEELRDDVIKESLLPWLDRVIENGTLKCENISEFEKMENDFNKAINSLKDFSISSGQRELYDYIDNELAKITDIKVIIQDEQGDNSFSIKPNTTDELEAFENIDLDVTPADRIEGKAMIQNLETKDQGKSQYIEREI